MIGLYGKIPAHGDFIRRNLPDSFVGPWDRWVQDGLSFARETLGEAFDDTWADAGVWRFRLGPGQCGPTAAEGVMVPSNDWVGRLFPIAVARLPRTDDAAMPSGWYDAVAALVTDAAGSGWKADDLAAALAPFEDAAAWPQVDGPDEGWWQGVDARPFATGLPPAPVFLSMLARAR